MKARGVAHGLEQKLFHLLNTNLASNGLDRLMRLFSSLGSAWASLGLCVLLWSFPGYRAHAAAVSFSVISSHMTVQALKRFFRRKRPYGIVSTMRNVTAKLSDPSFPSGHTTAAFSIVGAISAASGAAPIVLWPLACLTGISRIYLGHHYPTDVIVGAMIGIAFSLLTSHLLLT